MHNGSHWEGEISLHANFDTDVIEEQLRITWIKNWFWGKSPNTDVLSRGLKTLMSGCFRFNADSLPEIVVEVDDPRFWHSGCTIPYSWDSWPEYWDKRDDNVRDETVNIFENAIFLFYSDDTGSSTSGQPLKQMKLDFDLMTDGAVQIATELGLSLIGTKTRPPVWKQFPGAHAYADDIYPCLGFIREEENHKAVADAWAAEVASEFLSQSIHDGRLNRALQEYPGDRDCAIKAFNQLVDRIKLTINSETPGSRLEKRKRLQTHDAAKYICRMQSHHF